MKKFFGSKADHALFVIIVILIFVVVVGFLIYGQFFNDGPDVEEIIVESERSRLEAKVEFPTTIHVVGHQTDDRMNAVHDAVDGWGTATNGVTKVKVVSGWDPPRPFNISFYDSYHVNTLWFLDPADDHVALMLVNSDGPVDGASQGNFVVVINRPRMRGALLRMTLKHELGHLFGLVHLKSQWPGLMLKDPSMNGEIIGENDLIQFCFLYECEH